MGIVDSCSALVSLISDNWTASNTDNITPTINERYDEPALLSIDSKDYVVVYPSPGIIPEKNGIGSSNWRLNFVNSIDIWTTNSRAHAIKLLKEVQRILGAKLLAPGSDYTFLNNEMPITDLSDKTKKVWRFVCEARFVQPNTAR